MKPLQEVVANCPVLLQLRRLDAERAAALKSMKPLEDTLAEIDRDIAEAEGVLKSEGCTQDKAEKASLTLSALKARRDVAVRQLAEHPAHAAIADFDAQEKDLRQRRLGFGLRDTLRPHIQERTDAAKTHILEALGILNGTRAEIDEVMASNGVHDSWDSWARSVLRVEEAKVTERRLRTQKLQPLGSFYVEPT